MTMLEERVNTLAPGNTAPIPISAHKERSEITGEWIWIVNVLVRIPGITEYDVEGFGPTIHEAARRAYLGLNNEPRTRAQANVANAQFRVLV